jgi:hypothetical protein
MGRCQKTNTLTYEVNSHNKIAVLVAFLAQLVLGIIRILALV